MRRSKVSRPRSRDRWRAYTVDRMTSDDHQKIDEREVEIHESHFTMPARRPRVPRRPRRPASSRHIAYWSHFERPHLRSWYLPAGTMAASETQLGGLFEAQFRLRRRAHIARQADLAEKHALSRQGPAGKGGNERRGRRQIGRRLADFQAARNVQIDIVAADAKAGAGVEHGQDHRQPAGIPAHHGAARRAVAGGGHQRLHFDQQRPRAFEPGEHRSARRDAVAVAEEQRGRIGDFREARARHLEHADLVGGAEAVLHRAQDAEMMAALAFEIEHRIDEMLDRLWARDLAILGDMADEQHRGAASLWRSARDRTRRCAPARWCRARLRARDVQIVWMESMATMPGGLPASSVARMSSTQVADAQRHRRIATSPCARRAGAPAPSPLRRRYRRRGRRASRRPPAPAGSASICRRPDRRRRAAPSPAPSRRRMTRSNSAMPVARRGGASSSVLRSSSAKRRPLRAAARSVPAGARRLLRRSCSSRRRPRTCPDHLDATRRRTGRRKCDG